MFTAISHYQLTRPASQTYYFFTQWSRFFFLAIPVEDLDFFLSVLMVIGIVKSSVMYGASFLDDNFQYINFPRLGSGA